LHEQLDFDDISIDAPVEEVEHDPGQVRREGIAQLENPFEQCPPGRCGICSNEHMLAWKEQRVAAYYSLVDEIQKENGIPVW